jgi:hypothetical protein
MRITRTGEIDFDHPDSVISPSRQGTTALCAFRPKTVVGVKGYC